MPTPLRRRLRLLRRGIGYAVAIGLVLLALLLAVASQVLPLAESHPGRIAAWLSERAGRAVAFDRVETAWTRRGPLLRLDNLRVGEGANTFTVGDAEMLVSLYAGLLPGRAFSELRLRGLDLALERAADGRWRVRGLPGQEQAAQGDPLGALQGLGELQVIDGKLAVLAPQLGVDVRIPKIDLRLRVTGDRVRAGLRAWPSVGVPGTAASPLDAAIDFDRKRGDGRAYAGLRRAELAAWAPLLQFAGIGVESGQGRAEAWAELRGHRVVRVRAAAALERIGLRGAALGADPAPRLAFGRVDALARWQLAPGGWRLDAPRLRVGAGAGTQTLDGLRVAGGERYGLHAARLDAGPLLAAAALSDALPARLRQWLVRTRPQAALRGIAIDGRRGGPLHARARVDALGFAAVGDAPGLQGLAGDFEGDADGFSLRLDPASRFRFDWPRGFGVVHAARLQGTIGGWREGAGWRVATSGLRVRGDDIGLQLRGGLWWQGDGSRPWIDLAANVDTAAVPAAKGFWVRHRMPARVVQWLDAALIGGEVRDGRALVSGDLDEWPFRDRNGRFEADARLHQATVKFQPDWPAVEGLDAAVSFVADGFRVEGSGRLAGVGIRSIRAGIDRYKDGALTVQAEGGGDAAQLLALLRQSPLRKEHGETLRQLDASGPARVGFALDLPLRRGATAAIEGTVELADARLADPRWQLAFDQVRGRAQYSRDGFRAEGLRVRHEGQPGSLSLRAGAPYVRDPAAAFEAELDAALDADALLARAPDLAWLKPYLDGRSNWNVGVSMARGAGAANAAGLLRLRSNLAGTALDLPAPLHKPAGEALPATVEVPLPLGSGEIAVGLGSRMALRARSGNGQTGVRVALGSSRVEQPAPPHGLVASGRAATLDAIDWIALTQGGGRGGGLPVQRIDVAAERLRLLGGEFADTRLRVVPAPQGALAVQAEGEALAGALLVPAGPGAPIAGRFQRVHWRAPQRAAGAGAAAPASASASAQAPGHAPAPAAADAGFDPARIPPLTFEIDDLRVADARLGAAELRTRPSATGLRIERFRAQAPRQTIELDGDWSGRGAQARTRLDLRVDSEDLGALMNGLGYGGQLAGGEGSLRFQAGWNGSPAAFDPGSLDGRFTADVRNGRLLEVEPGAGRVLGLLSIAQLPRRLMLDFRDFFSKGFAFNRAGGEVRFEAGQARSDDLSIDGPAASIAIRGSADLRAQRFDQTVEVRPKAGNLLTVAGALAGGPVGAAIGAAANAVLSKPLGQIAARTYRVTGPWKDPKVEVIGGEQSRAAAARPPGAG
ncbi:uncharacterized protein (TIGR02099 family) [Vulcaniibacterium tengchongense]|uniref:Uncharacterized protein (TIGR02099 family) n=2 Tax=Vulcaniibacterium tengchongense TaxID=1273429 RepID=A0A3N4VB96_9GAMM|nr:YhdP family protein [Vulcaniibacterium tengchongense]RPE76971.1 uncharacterized protein (TIGR02099 family) [Vulcaniibacterium tengchongense]